MSHAASALFLTGELIPELEMLKKISPTLKKGVKFFPYINCSN